MRTKRVRFSTFLSGRNEVPPVNTLSTGRAVLETRRNGTRLAFVLAVNHIAKMTKAHIHLGRKGTDGPIVATLFGPSRFGITTRHGVVKGVLTNARLAGPLRGKTIADLVREIERGNAYINVHTIQHPNGEIRGQLHRLRY